MSWNSRWRWFVLSIGTLFVLIIGWTRLYLGVHYPSDVLAGWMVAVGGRLESACQMGSIDD
ncbi:MAG: phosphatase PAP2 family protein [Nostoc sp.]|uniref:phosphatase PAP2 family protein n=1 Tax=Nostoc sp. TaxID=1180 RepID=UPI002FF6A3BA